jgi:anaerobic selenocysteine-containing dehydrogenase
MSESTRRGFLKIAGAGAAVGAAVVATSAATKSGDTAPAGTAAVPAGATGALVAYVRDVRGSEVSVLVGDTEIVVQDKDLVARLAAARAKTSA